MSLTAPVSQGTTRHQSSPDRPQVCEVFQWKYDVGPSAPWWRRLYFHFIYYPFAWFSFRVVKIVPFDRLEPDGSLSFKHEQGVWESCADATREAARYPFGGYRVVVFNAAESDDPVYGRTHFPNSPAWKEYERVASKEQVAVARELAGAVAEAQAVIDAYRSHSRV